MMKKVICALLSLLMLLYLAGCGGSESPFMADNEIITYNRIDPEKTQIIVSRTGNIPVEQFCSAFEAANPDIQVVFVDITGGNSAYTPAKDWIVNGDLPDVVMTAADFFDKDIIAEYFVNLSENPIVNSYEAAALQRVSVNANIYWLPGPSDISAMMYNKTLFDEYGWEVPTTFNEFVALCLRITEDTGGTVQPWNPNAKYGNELTMAIEAFCYEELFGGATNREWYNSVTDGTGVLTGHMEPYIEVLETLIENGILREEHFSYSATSRGIEFGEGKIAMINMKIYDADNENFDFSFMPYPTTSGDIGYLCDSYSCYVGLPIKEHTEAEESAIKRLIEYFSSPEGQEAYIGNSMKISNVKDIGINNSDDLSALQPAIDAGHLFAMLEFIGRTSNRSLVGLHSFATSLISGEKSGSECLAEADEKLKTPSAAVAEEPEILCNAEKDFSILETSFLIADAYRDATGSDIALITQCEAYYGNLMRIYSGDITQAFVTVLKPRSFTNNSTLVKATMTGKELLAALNDPVGNTDAPECVYAYSGLKCKIAPWNERGAKYLSVTLEDGSNIQDDESYTVAFWSGGVKEEYLSKAPEVIDGSWEEIMTAYLKVCGTIAPSKGRIELVWE